MTSRGLAGRVVVRRDGFHLDVELDLAPERTTAVLGPNGAGKSTLLAALAGLVPLDDGRLAHDGRVLDEPATGAFVPPPDRRMGVVFQDGLLFDHLDVRGNVAFGPRSRGAGRAEARRAADDWLARLGVAELADRRPVTLSGGQAQRVALARALAVEPDVLLLDEPLSALDVAGRAGLRRVLGEQLAAVPGPRLLVTHDPVEAFLLADDVLVLEGGRCTQRGTPDELRRRPRTPYAADLVGTNLLRGVARDGEVAVGDALLVVADRTVSGPVVCTVHPHAVALSRHRPEGGSQRNTWSGRVAWVEPLDDRVRVEVDGPVSITAEVTPAAVADLGLAVGVETWVAVKATEVVVTADAGP